MQAKFMGFLRSDGFFTDKLAQIRKHAVSSVRKERRGKLLRAPASQPGAEK